MFAQDKHLFTKLTSLVLSLILTLTVFSTANTNIVLAETFAAAGDQITVAANYNLRLAPRTDSSKVALIKAGETVTVKSKVTGGQFSLGYYSGNVWYEIIYDNKTCFLCHDPYHTISKKGPSTTSKDSESTSASTGKAAGKAYTDAEWQEVLKSFPESYRGSLDKLHQQYPAWRFEPEYHDFSLEYAIDIEKAYNGRNTAPRYYGGRYIDPYDSKQYDAGGWVAASRETIGFVMDPRNWLTEKYIFMFEKISEVKDIPSEGRLRAMFAGNQDLLNMIPAIIQASNDHEINPVFVGARIKTEVGIGNTVTAPAKGTLKVSQQTINNLGDRNFRPDLSKTYYNVFNIGASDGSNPQLNGILYAMGYQTSPQRQKELKLPWDSQYKAVYGGITFIRNDYIDNKQNTNYYMKYNMRWPKSQVNNHIWHQYMTNAFAPVTEASVQYSANKKAGTLSEAYSFLIPVYENMGKQYSDPGNRYYDSAPATMYVPGGNDDFDITKPKQYAEVGDTIKLKSAFWVRSKPTTSGNTGITVLDINSKFEVLEKVRGQHVDEYTDLWYKVKYSGGTGYIIAYPPTQEVIKKASNPTTAPSTKTTTKTTTKATSKTTTKPTTKATTKASTKATTKATSKSTTKPAKTSRPGDVNGDGKIDVVDLSLMEYYILRRINLNSQQLKAADVNGDGVVNVIDLSMVEYHILGRKLLK